jgi:hypothetical protein
MMRYLTHEFAHPETLERARRWLVHAGFDSSQIEAMTDGIPRLAVRVRAGEVFAAEQIIGVAELTDPDGLPSFWDLARQRHVRSRVGGEHPAASVPSGESRTFVVGYRVPDDRPELGASSIAVAMRDAYMGRHG